MFTNILPLPFITSRCYFDIDLIDKTDTLTASILGELAKSLLKHIAVEAFDHHKEVSRNYCAYSNNTTFVNR